MASKRTPKDRYYRSNAGPNKRYHLYFGTVDDYMEECENYVPGAGKGWAFYLYVESYDDFSGEWFSDDCINYGLVDNVREALELAYKDINSLEKRRVDENGAAPR
jgi:hypothetical protein